MAWGKKETNAMQCNQKQVGENHYRGKNIQCLLIPRVHTCTVFLPTSAGILNKDCG